jgi:hypothetical protein
MIVCSHGDVNNYCEDKEMIIGDSYSGDIEDYDGVCRVLVTDTEMTESEYYFLKGKMLSKGVELVSIHHKDTQRLSDYVIYSLKHESEHRKRHIGRYKFGFRLQDGVVVHHEETYKVAKLIIELKDKGYTLRRIQEDSRVKHADGRKLSISTIQLIIKNRKDYE